MSDEYTFNDDENLLLEAVFTYNRHPTREKQLELARRVGVHEKNVFRWFRYNRKRYHQGSGMNSSSLCKFILNIFAQD